MTIVLGGGDFNRILDVLEEQRHFLLISHVNPDGDAIGSVLGLGLGLRRLGKKVTFVRQAELPATFTFLPGFDLFVPVEEVQGEFDAAVFLDCAERDRAGSAADLDKLAKVTINIDHHATNPGYGDLNWVDVDASATGELVYQILSALSVNLTEEVAMSLYTAIATDTGFFRYSNTSPDSLLVCAHCVAAGVRPDAVSEAIHASRTEASLRLQAAALGTLAVSGGGLVASLAVTKAMREQAGAVDDDTEGLISLPRSLAGVRVAMLFRETDTPGNVRISFRARGAVDVSALAAQFGGGGHERAAGCTFNGTIDEALEQVTSAAVAAAEAAVAAEMRDEARRRPGLFG